MPTLGESTIQSTILKCWEIVLQRDTVQVFVIYDGGQSCIPLRGEFDLNGSMQMGLVMNDMMACCRGLLMDEFASCMDYWRDHKKGDLITSWLGLLMDYAMTGWMGLSMARLMAGWAYC